MVCWRLQQQVAGRLPMDGRMAPKATEYQQIELLRKNLALSAMLMPTNASDEVLLVPKVIKAPLVVADVCVRSNGASTSGIL